MCWMNIFQDTLNYCIIYRAYDYEVPAGQYCRIFAKKNIKKGLKVGDRILIDEKTSLGNITKRHGRHFFVEPTSLDWHKKEYLIKLFQQLLLDGWSLKSTGYAGVKLIQEAIERNGYGT